MEVTIPQQYAKVTLQVSPEKQFTVMAELLEVEEEMATFQYRVPIGIAIFDIPVQSIVKIQLKSYNLDTQKNGFKTVSFEQLQIHYTNMYIMRSFKKN